MMTGRRIKFCQIYVANHCDNATQAARDAGYNGEYVSNVAHEMLKNFEVQLYIEELKAQEAAVAGITRESVLEAFGKIAFNNVRDIFDTSGGIRPLHEMTEAASYAIEGVEVVANKQGDDVEYIHKIKTAKKLDALKELGKHFNIYEDHQASNGTMVVNFDGKFANV